MKLSPKVLFETGRRFAVQGEQAITQAHEQVEALLTYLVPTDKKPFAHTYEPGTGEPRRSGDDDAHHMTIRNARLTAKEFSLDKQGFELIAFPTRETDFYDDDQVRSLYYKEIERRLKELIGATKVIISNHTVRSAAGAKDSNDRVQGPVLRVHNDYTIKSGPDRVRDLVPNEAERLLQHRFAAINVWRAIRGPVKQAPLALCDAESVQSRDLVATDLMLRDRVSETYKVIYNASHRWYYFPDMQEDEAILIKCYDSDESRARFTPHAAFDDPTTPPDAPPRESIEVRTFAFFGPKGTAT
jgi:hypothetical protein